MISGTEFYRSKVRMSIRELSERSGVCAAVLVKLCGGEPPMNTPLSVYMRAAEALDVSLADLLKMHDERELDIGDQAAYPSRTERMTNCVAVYRRAKGLTYEQYWFELDEYGVYECGVIWFFDNAQKDAPPFYRSRTWFVVMDGVIDHYISSRENVLPELRKLKQYNKEEQEAVEKGGDAA